MVKDFNVKVTNLIENKEAQELFFKIGASWCYGKQINENIPSDCDIILHNFGSQLFWAHTYETENFKDSEEITLQALRDMVVLKRESLNDKIATAEVARQQSKNIDATLAERQSQYGSFEDVAFVTENIMSTLAKVRSNRLHDLPHTHRMALYMIASKMARIVNGDFNHLDSWHDIGGYSKLIEDLITLDQ